MGHDEDYQAKLNAYVEGKDPLAMQSTTADVIAKLVANVSDQDLQTRPVPGKWSVAEIVAHLAEDELVTSWRYRQMIENRGCALASFDQDKWAQLGDYGSWNAAEALQMFRLLREVNLRMLRQLSAEDWDAFGVHAERGRISVRDLARHMAAHDGNHVDQIRVILGHISQCEKWCALRDSNSRTSGS
jgi:uncharacterized damage-inducible protein DinB